MPNSNRSADERTPYLLDVALTTSHILEQLVTIPSLVRRGDLDGVENALAAARMFARNDVRAIAFALVIAPSLAEEMAR